MTSEVKKINIVSGGITVTGIFWHSSVWVDEPEGWREDFNRACEAFYNAPKPDKILVSADFMNAYREAIK